jgi:hypothetical protein
MIGSVIAMQYHKLNYFARVSYRRSHFCKFTNAMCFPVEKERRRKECDRTLPHPISSIQV